MCYILYTVHIIYRKVLSLAISVNPSSLSLNVLALFLLKTSRLLWQSNCMELLCQDSAPFEPPLWSSSS